jgi:hypothetical protein
MTEAFFGFKPGTFSSKHNEDEEYADDGDRTACDYADAELRVTELGLENEVFCEGDNRTAKGAYQFNQAERGNTSENEIQNDADTRAHENVFNREKAHHIQPEIIFGYEG